MKSPIRIIPVLLLVLLSTSCANRSVSEGQVIVDPTNGNVVFKPFGVISSPVSVYVNDQLIEVKDRDMDFVYALSPGNYHIVIQAPDCLPWERTVTVLQGGQRQVFVVTIVRENE